MKEILTSGNITKDFNRLGVIVRQTYKGKRYGVCKVTDEELEILCNESDIKNTWNNCGWRYCEGSNLGEPTIALLVNGHSLKCWYDPIDTEDEETYIPEYTSLLEYLCDGVGISQFKNVCVASIDLAKYNRITMTKLFKKYQDNK